MHPTLNATFLPFSRFLFHFVFTLRLGLLANLPFCPVDLDGIYVLKRKISAVKPFAAARLGKKSKNWHFVERGIIAQLSRTVVKILHSK